MASFLFIFFFDILVTWGQQKQIQNDIIVLKLTFGKSCLITHPAATNIYIYIYDEILSYLCRFMLWQTKTLEFKANELLFLGSLRCFTSNLPKALLNHASVMWVFGLSHVQVIGSPMNKQTTQALHQHKVQHRRSSSPGQHLKEFLKKNISTVWTKKTAAL